MNKIMTSGQSTNLVKIWSFFMLIVLTVDFFPIPPLVSVGICKNVLELELQLHLL